MSECFYAIYDWQTELGLKNSELNVFALICSFTQQDREFTGSVNYLAQRAACSRATVFRALEALEQQGLIKKNVTLSDGVKTVSYIALKTQSQNETGSLKMRRGVSQNETGVSQNETGGSLKMRPNNKEYNKVDNKEYKESKERDKRFTKFWDVYPKHKACKKAEEAFAKIKPDDELLSKMLNAIEQQKKSRQWQEDNGKYIPYPATWLNGKRWEDELTEATDVSKDHIKGSNYDLEAIEQEAKEIVEFSL